MKHSRSLVLLLIVALFCAVSFGGCGGSSSNSFSDNNSGNNSNNGNSNNGNGNGNNGNNDAAASETVLSLEHNMDTDGNGVPDFVDFSNVPHYDLDSSHATASNGGLFSASAMVGAAALNVSVPAILTLSELRLQEEPNTFTVALEAGKEYTIQFSKNMAEALEAVMPRLKIYDPENSELPELEAEALDVKIKAYPPEHPSIICYTFKPEVSGDYLVRVADAEPSTAFVESPDEEADTYDINTACMIFIFEEAHDNEGNTGHHTQYKFVDVDGKKTGAINIEDLIQLRKELWKLDNESYNNIVRTTPAANASGVYASALNVFASATEEQSNSYNSWLDRVQDKLGLVAVGSNEQEPEGEETYGEGDDAYGIEYYGADNTYTGNKRLTPADYRYSEIPATMTGIPYDDTYSLGAGFYAITNLSPIGGMEMPKFDQLLAPSEASYAKKAPAVKTYYTGTFVSTRTEAEALSNTNGRMSMSKNSMGASASVESTQNFKYGLTSTNYVIHYEQVESIYREFNSSVYEKLLYQPLKNRKPKNPIDPNDVYTETQQVWSAPSVNASAASDRTIMDWIETLPAEVFRDNFGDYFVSGYQYGAFFDAYIAITTETAEQLEKLKVKVQATMDTKDVKASADVGTEISNALKNSNAKVTIRIVTNGMGKKPIEINITHSNDYAATTTGIMSVFTELMNFRNKLTKDVNPDEYAPVRVKLKRWRSIFDIGMTHEDQVGTGMGDDYVARGYVPIPATKLVDIGRLNAALAETRGHWNDAMSIPNASNFVKLRTAGREFSGLLSTITGKGNRFYTSDDLFAPMIVSMDKLDEVFRAYSDRYAFFNKLKVAQRNEEETYNSLKKTFDDGSTSSDGKKAAMRKMPFGGATGGSSGYDAFDCSEYVTADIKAGQKPSKNYTRDIGVGWWRWHADHKEGDDDYREESGPATLTATTGNEDDRARFCKLWVSSTARHADSDNRREVVNLPAVGKQEAQFEFEGGYDYAVNWTIKGQSIKMNGEDYPFEGLD